MRVLRGGPVAITGRDDRADLLTALMAGFGIRGVHVVGRSTPDGYPEQRHVHARDMVATAYAALRIVVDAAMEPTDGRPIPVLSGARCSESTLV